MDLSSNFCLLNEIFALLTKLCTEGIFKVFINNKETKQNVSVTRPAADPTSDELWLLWCCIWKVWHIAHSLWSAFVWWRSRVVGKAVVVWATSIVTILLTSLPVHYKVSSPMQFFLFDFSQPTGPIMILNRVKWQLTVSKYFCRSGFDVSVVGRNERW